MTIDVVSCDEVFFMLLLRGNYAFESLWLYDDGGCCVARWDVFHVVTAWHLCFWKPFIIRWWWVLCLFLKAGRTINSVRVVLLKARGWRGTSLPRVCDNMLFSNPVRVLLLPITWQMWKSWTRSGFISCVYLFPTYLISFTNVGLSEAQLVPSCDATQRVYDAI